MSLLHITVKETTLLGVVKNTVVVHFVVPNELIEIIAGVFPYGLTPLKTWQEDQM